MTGRSTTAVDRRTEKMAKTEEKPRPDVVWNLLNDAVEPRPAPFGFVVRNPVARSVPPKGKIQIRLGVSANVPMFAWARGDMRDYVTLEKEFIAPGTEVTVVVENKSEHSSLIVDDLEVLANVHPLVFKGTAGLG